MLSTSANSTMISNPGPIKLNNCSGHGWNSPNPSQADFGSNNEISQPFWGNYTVSWWIYINVRLRAFDNS